MKALVYKGPRELVLEDVPIPKLEQDEVLIKVAYSGICGSELSGYLGQSSLRKPPLIFGHEFSGTIVDLNRPSNKLEVGQRVTVNPLITCGECSYCLSGKQQLCINRKLLSAALPGSNAAFVKVASKAVYPLPKHISDEKGALVEPIACAVRVAEIADAKPFDNVLIIGMGPIGLLILQLVKQYGASNVIAMDLNDARLEMARKYGAVVINPKKENVISSLNHLTDEKGVTIAIDAVGLGVTRNQCVELVQPGGKVIFSGLSESDSKLPINTIVRNEIQSIGSFAYSSINFRTALKLLADNKIDLPENSIQTVPLGEGQIWFEKLLSNNTDFSKVLLFP